jgi:hypothetical protein
MTGTYPASDNTSIINPGSLFIVLIELALLMDQAFVGEHPVLAEQLNLPPAIEIVLDEGDLEGHDLPVFQSPAPVVAGCPAPVDYVEQAFADAFAGRTGCIVLVIRCEGWNRVGEYNLAHISPTSDVGPAQINQIHGQRGGIIEGRWPEAVQTLEGNIWATLQLHNYDGWSPWKNSRHCHGQW